MSEKFNNRHRVQTPRMRNWDYGWSGNYLITVVTKNRIQFLEKMVKDEVVLSEIGAILSTEWYRTPGVRPSRNITLGEFVIMPDHFHGIICIGDNPYNATPPDDFGRRDATHRVSTTNVN